MDQIDPSTFTGEIYVTTDEISEDTGWIYVTTLYREMDDGEPWRFNGDWFRRLVRDDQGRQFGIIGIVNPENRDSMVMSPYRFKSLDLFAEQLATPPPPNQAEWNEQFPKIESEWDSVSF